MLSVGNGSVPEESPVFRDAYNHTWRVTISPSDDHFSGETFKYDSGLCGQATNSSTHIFGKKLFLSQIVNIPCTCIATYVYRQRVRINTHTGKSVSSFVSPITVMFTALLCCPDSVSHQYTLLSSVLIWLLTHVDSFFFTHHLGQSHVTLRGAILTSIWLSCPAPHSSRLEALVKSRVLLGLIGSKAEGEGPETKRNNHWKWDSII